MSLVGPLRVQHAMPRRLFARFPDSLLSDEELAHGRLPKRQPEAVVDIGSNSVRLVVYEGVARAPTLLFNEKILCGLGQIGRAHV